MLLCKIYYFVPPLHSESGCASRADVPRERCAARRAYRQSEGPLHAYPSQGHISMLRYFQANAAFRLRAGARLSHRVCLSRLLWRFKKRLACCVGQQHETVIPEPGRARRCVATLPKYEGRIGGTRFFALLFSPSPSMFWVKFLRSFPRVSSAFIKRCVRDGT